MTSASQAAPHGHTAEHYDPIGAKMGMWLFLFTEVMLFGGLFIAFAVYQHLYPGYFAQGTASLHRIIGTINTVVLLTSSLTVALSIAALERGDRKSATLALLATMAMAGMFLLFKSFEWSEKFSHGIYPSSPWMLQQPGGLQVFYGLYFGMTGLHALHVIIGGLALGVALWRIRRGQTTAERPLFLSNVGLYWHLVDLVWIYLFPIFYLIG